MSIDEALGRTIQVLRVSEGMSRRQLAQRASISYSYLSAIENGAKRPSAKILTVIAEALGMRASELMAAAEARAVGAGRPGEAADVDETDALLNRLDERQTYRRLARLGFRSEPPAEMMARSEMPARLSSWAPEPEEELRRLLRQMDPDDVERLLDLARRLARRSSHDDPDPPGSRW